MDNSTKFPEKSAARRKETPLERERLNSPFLKPGWGRLRGIVVDDNGVPVVPERKKIYEIKDVIGVGGFGITYRAEDCEDGKVVAIKENFPSQFASRVSKTAKKIAASNEQNEEGFEKALSNFKKERDNLLRFRSHENIVSVHPVLIEDHNTSYIVMDFLEGRTLTQAIEDRKREGKPFPEDDLLEIVEGVCDALEEIHRSDFYHRDIKPGNIVLAPAPNSQLDRQSGKKEPQVSFRPVLIDFGAARYDTGDATRSLLNTRSEGYTPHEQIITGGLVGPWSDIYALSATLYCAIVGEPPPDSLGRMPGADDSIKSLAWEKEYLEDYSKEFLAAIDHGLKLHSKDRPQSIEEWRRELYAKPEGLLHDVPTFAVLNNSGAENEREEEETEEVPLTIPGDVHIPVDPTLVKESNKVRRGLGIPMPMKVILILSGIALIFYVYSDLNLSGDGDGGQNGGSASSEPQIPRGGGGSGNSNPIPPHGTSNGGTTTASTPETQTLPPKTQTPPPVTQTTPSEIVYARERSGGSASAGKKAEVWGDLLIGEPFPRYNESDREEIKSNFVEAVKAMMKEAVRDESGAVGSADKALVWDKYLGSLDQYRGLVPEADDEMKMAEKNRNDLRSVLDLNNEFLRKYADMAPRPDDGKIGIRERQKSWSGFYEEYEKMEFKLDVGNRERWRVVKELMAEKLPSSVQVSNFVVEFLEAVESNRAFEIGGHLSDPIIFAGSLLTRDQAISEFLGSQNTWTSISLEIPSQIDVVEVENGGLQWKAELSCQALLTGKYNSLKEGQIYNLTIIESEGQFSISSYERKLNRGEFPESDRDYGDLSDLLGRWIETNGRDAGGFGPRQDIYDYPVKYGPDTLDLEEMRSDFNKYNSNEGWHVKSSRLSQEGNIFTISFTAGFTRTVASKGAPAGPVSRDIILKVRRVGGDMKIFEEREG